VGIAIFALGAASKSLPRRLRTIAATIGLLTSSAVLVHLSGGSIEMHFHFFVMVPLVALYQDWVTFLVAIAYVALHHGLAGTLDPHSVFNHPAALNHPWKWAAIHALFIAGISAVCLTTWRLLEFALASARAEARVKGEFLSVMSHEIRTPLTAVIGYAGLLADMGLSPEQKQYADTIRRSGDRLLTLINDVLDYSKLEAGRLDLDEAPFDMLPLVDDTVVLVSDIAQQRGVRLSSLVDNSVPRTAIGDGGRIAQVLLNLVSNAVKFTENGEVFVHVSARPVGSGEHEVTMAVRDTGIGIDVSTAERLFDSFTQAEASISRQYGGTGLGLAIARQLCELMGGTIRLESTPGEGSTFSASFIVEEATPNRKRHDVPKSLAGLRALVVGQQDANESLLVRYLSEWGVRPRVTNASQALLWARSGMNFGIVFVLHSKDETDPFGFAVELKTLLAKRRTPLVLVAGPSAPGESAEVFDSVLLDPLRQSAVYDLVTSVGAAEQEPHPEIESHAKLAERYPLRILVAEDNHVTQKVILAQLKRLGYRADAVANGVEAVEATGVRPYDLILMDMHMPDMDGPTAARVIRDRAGEYSPAIVALTADATADARAACREAGMEGFVTKPVRESEFVAALIRCAGGIGAAQQAS
jgi:signal transduction histidine kinase/FixJ family two-component response regulator